jgi:glyoxylase-like metal-dependent hydrolase (beta-lactamase superfamily II)
VVTHESNQAFYDTAWRGARTLRPDALSESGQEPTFQAVGERGELTDGRRRIELHAIADNAHTSGFLMAYLPQERILIEADAFTPGPEGAPPPATPNANTVALYDNVMRLGLNVNQILALHGPRVATMADLRRAAGR